MTTAKHKINLKYMPVLLEYNSALSNQANLIFATCFKNNFVYISLTPFFNFIF